MPTIYLAFPTLRDNRVALQNISTFPFICRILIISLLLIFSPVLTRLSAVNKAPLSNSNALKPIVNNKLLPIPLETVEKMEKKGQRAILYSSIGLGLVMTTVILISLGTLGATLPLFVLGLAALFGNIGFIKAMRIRARTKSRKKTFAKARKRAKIALILSCVLGITLIFGLLHLLIDQRVAP